MKSTLHVLLSCLFLALPLHAQAQSKPLPEKALASVPAEWPGVHFDITRILRLDDEYILVAVRIRGDATTKGSTMISGRYPTRQEEPDAISPYTLTKATLLDQQTGQQYPADDKLPASPYWGSPKIITSLRPNTWFQLAVRFKAPALPPGPDGKPTEQKVTFTLPNAKEPMKDVILPQR